MFRKSVSRIVSGLFICLSITFLLHFSVSHSNADVSQPDKRFYYQIRLPESARSCQDEAMELAGRFSKATGLKVVDRDCKSVIELSENGTKYRLYSLGLTYLAKYEVFPYSVFFGDAYMNVPAQAVGIYETYSACLSDITKQTAFYESHTGYPVLAATCQAGTYEYEKSFALRIDGFSADPKVKEPKLKLYAFTAKFVGQADDSLKKTVENLVSNLGGQVVLKNKSTVFYYSKYPLSIRYEYLRGFIVADECVSQLGEIHAIFSNLGSKTVIARCLPDQDPQYAGSASLEVVRDHVAGDPSYFHVADSSQYYSFAECIGDRARAMDEATSRGQNPLGVLCYKTWNDKYEMQLFKRLF